MSEYCVICGDEIPEGRQVCPTCEQNVMHGDIVAVTRCKDCKFFVEGDEEAGYCKNLNIGAGRNEFCSDGRTA